MRIVVDSVDSPSVEATTRDASKPKNERLIAPRPYQFVIAVWKAKAAQSSSEGPGNQLRVNPTNFLTELKRRNVYRAAVAYGVVAWFLTQLTTQVFPFFEIPNSAVRFVVIALAVGFPIAMLLAWVYEFTPEGVVRTEDLDPVEAKSVQRRSGRLLDFIIIGALLLVIAMLVVGRLPFYRQTGESISQKSIAILPFENLSEEKGNAYFAEGIKDEILTKLAAVRDLKVISRTSTAKYQSKPDNLKSVAQELGVATILEGAVQKAGEKVRVNVQLIDARADTHLWAKSYDRDLEDILAVESEVSQEIAEALQANLSPSESHTLASAGTGDAEAYDLFLRGEYEFHQSESREDADANNRAEEFYRQALARDPNFADAAAGLARSRLRRHWFFSPLTPSQLKDVTSIIDRALALAPNLSEAHLALGLFFYRGHRQYGIALTEFNHTLELQPNNALARLYSAWVYRRRGEWERSLADLQRAQELDPRDAGILVEIGNTYQAFRLWKDAERAELRALAMDPHNRGAADTLLKTNLNATGDADSARRAFDGFPAEIKSNLSGLAPGGFEGGTNVIEAIGIPVYLDLIQRRFSDAFEALEKEPAQNDRERLLQLVGRAVLRLLAGQTEAAKSAAEQALPLLEASLRERPDDAFAITELSWIYLALGRNAYALRLSRQAGGFNANRKRRALRSNFPVRACANRGACGRTCGSR